MRKKLRILALLLAAVSALCVLSACSQSAPENTPGGTSATDPNGTGEAPVLLDADFEGYTFRIMTAACCPQHADGLWSEDGSRGVVDSAVFTRNRVIEDRYRVFIEQPLTTPDAMPDDLMVGLLSGVSMCDLVVLQQYYVGALSLNGVLVNQKQLPYQDFTRDWWSDLTYEFELEDQIYASYGCINTDNITMLGCLYFNRSLFQNTFSDENLYKLVKDRKWTLERYMNFISDGSKDLNGDGEWTLGTDQFGMTSYVGYLSQFLASCEISVTEKDANGIPHYTVYNQKAIDLYDDIATLFLDYSGVYWDETNQYINFVSGKTLFFADTLECGRSQMNKVEYDWGIVPYPLYEEGQQSYHCRAVPHASLIGVPINNSDDARTSLILEALCMYGNEYIRPALYDTILKSRVVKDPETADMIDIVYYSSSANFVDIYGGWVHLGLILDMSIRERNGSLSTYYNANLTQCNKELADSIAFFQKAKEGS